ncbi:MAG: hypothetical protein K2H46_01690 [Muribaculaceae bacterium]|nr:hypothetical protein [Muribaculaceae bacterium]
MAKKEKEEPAEKKLKLSVEEKNKLIAEVRVKLNTPDLQTLFDEYCGLKHNAKLSKNLQDTNTDWEEVLTNWKATKDKKEGKQEKKVRILKNPKTIISKIEEEIKANTFNSIQTAISYCQDLIKVLEEKQEKLKQDQINALKKQMEVNKEQFQKQMEADEAQLKALEEK